jgi:hypothetical protein
MRLQWRTPSLPVEDGGEDELRTIFITAAAVLMASPAFAAPATPTQLEMETWRAFQAKRVGEIKSLFAPDFVGVYADGTHDLARELQSLKVATIEDYKIANLQSHSLDRDNVMLTYDADVRLLTGRKTISRKIWMGSLWERRGGRWLCVYHTEIKAK